MIEILLKISDNSTFVIDEIDRCLHPAMATKIIELFLQMAEKRNLENAFSCETILNKLRAMNFADIQEQGFIPLYTRDKLTDALHTVCGFETDYKFITKRQMKNIQKKTKAENKNKRLNLTSLYGRKSIHG